MSSTHSVVEDLHIPTQCLKDIIKLHKQFTYINVLVLEHYSHTALLIWLAVLIPSLDACISTVEMLLNIVVACAIIIIIIIIIIITSSDDIQPSTALSDQ